MPSPKWTAPKLSHNLLRVMRQRGLLDRIWCRHPAHRTIVELDPNLPYPVQRWRTPIGALLAGTPIAWMAEENLTARRLYQLREAAGYQFNLHPFAVLSLIEAAVEPTHPKRDHLEQVLNVTRGEALLAREIAEHYNGGTQCAGS